MPLTCVSLITVPSALWLRLSRRTPVEAARSVVEPSKYASRAALFSAVRSRSPVWTTVAAPTRCHCVAPAGDHSTSPFTSISVAPSHWATRTVAATSRVPTSAMASQDRTPGAPRDVRILLPSPLTAGHTGLNGDRRRLLQRDTPSLWTDGRGLQNR